jgi:glycosyltransferase involved in cell wall biosynthesis
MRNKSYVLITAAKNEEAYIGRTLEAVAAQTLPPEKWIVVSDGSTDGTDELVRRFASRYKFIELFRLENRGERVFSSQAYASNAGYEQIRQAQFNYLGFLDADISLPANYYEDLLAKFEMQTRLGVAGGVIVEERSGRNQIRYADSAENVAGAIQMFRRQCYEEVGGLIPLRWGGHDAVANAMARRRGWEVRAFADLRVLHLRPTGTAGATIQRARFREGMQDYFMGYHFLYELCKCLRRCLEPPYVTGSILRLAGYLWPGITRQKPNLPKDFVHYVRQQQLHRLTQGLIGRYDGF